MENDPDKIAEILLIYEIADTYKPHALLAKKKSQNIYLYKIYVIEKEII